MKRLCLKEKKEKKERGRTLKVGKSQRRTGVKKRPLKLGENLNRKIGELRNKR